VTGQDAATVPTPVVAPGGAGDDTTVLRPVRDDEQGPGRASAGSDAEVTAELPKPPVPPVAEERTEVLPQVPDRDAFGAADETAVLPPVRPGDAEETAVLPPVRPADAEETAVLPPVRGDEPADRVPPEYFRKDAPVARPDGTEDRTREMPQVDADGTPRRRRSDWAEETPLDDLPSLADELLGPHDEEPDEGRGRRGRGGRGR
jgi:dTMP kinase